MPKFPIGQNAKILITYCPDENDKEYSEVLAMINVGKVDKGFQAIFSANVDTHINSRDVNRGKFDGVGNILKQTNPRKVLRYLENRSLDFDTPDTRIYIGLTHFLASIINKYDHLRVIYYIW